jgi:hypothetical protein
VRGGEGEGCGAKCRGELGWMKTHDRGHDERHWAAVARARGGLGWGGEGLGEGWRGLHYWINR